jgi:hypothetical protein
VQDTASEFVLRVVNSAGWVGKRDQLVLDGGIKGDAPEQGCTGVNEVLDKRALTQCVDLHITANSLRRWEPHATGAPTRGIVGTQQGWLHWDQLLEARRAIAHAVGEPPEIIDGIVKTFVEVRAARGIGANGSLHGTEKAPCTWKRNRHGAQLAQEPVPRVQGQAFLAGVNGVQEGREALLAPWRQFP